MTVEEFELLVLEALDARPMELWEQIDLEIILRFVKLRGWVTHLDRRILDWSGRGMDDATTKRVVWRNSKPRRPPIKQGSLF